MKNTNTFVTDAINIKSYPLSENDNIVVMFSRDKGLIKGIAKGVKWSEECNLQDFIQKWTRSFS